MRILHRYLRLTVTAAALAACFSFASYAAESDDTAGPGIAWRRTLPARRRQILQKGGASCWENSPPAATATVRSVPGDTA